MTSLARAADAVVAAATEVDTAAVVAAAVAVAALIIHVNFWEEKGF